MQKAESGKLEELGRCACELRSLRRAALVPSQYYSTVLCTSCGVFNWPGGLLT